jgi:hypothetical protein
MLSSNFLQLAHEMQTFDSEAAHRRAISTAYYAVFHGFAEILTSALLGFDRPARTEPTREDWVRVYRALDHATLGRAVQDQARKHKQQGHKAAGLWTDLSAALVRLKECRHLADYDPYYDLSAENVTKGILGDAAEALLLMDALLYDRRSPESAARSLAIEALLKVKDRK